MIRFMVSNQRGGVAKTTTALTLASLMASAGKRVLLIDTDPQGSVHSILGLRAQHDLFDAMIAGVVFDDCLLKPSDRLHILPSTRRTAEAEQQIANWTGRDFVFLNFFTPIEADYDAVIIDVAPSISLLQQCAMVYTKNVLVPVAMETLSIQGAGASIWAVQTVNEMLGRVLPEPVRVLGLLPVMVNRRLAITQTELAAVEKVSESHHLSVLPPIRTDQAVVKAVRDRRLLLDHEPDSKALEDYRTVLAVLLACFGETVHEQPAQQEAAAQA